MHGVIVETLGGRLTFDIQQHSVQSPKHTEYSPREMFLSLLMP